MNWLSIMGIIFITMACIELVRIIADYATGKLAFWPFGAEVGAALFIWLGVFLVRKGRRRQGKTGDLK